MSHTYPDNKYSKLALAIIELVDSIEYCNSCAPEYLIELLLRKHTDIKKEGGTDMLTYQVTLSKYSTQTVVVSAHNEEEAKESSHYLLQKDGWCDDDAEAADVVRIEEINKL